MSNNKRSGITLKTKYEILLDIDKGDIEINCFKPFFKFSPIIPCCQLSLLSSDLA